MVYATIKVSCILVCGVDASIINVSAEGTERGPTAECDARAARATRRASAKLADKQSKGSRDKFAVALMHKVWRPPKTKSADGEPQATLHAGGAATDHRAALSRATAYRMDASRTAAAFPPPRTRFRGGATGIRASKRESPLDESKQDTGVLSKRRKTQAGDVDLRHYNGGHTTRSHTCLPRSQHLRRDVHRDIHVVKAAQERRRGKSIRR